MNAVTAILVAFIGAGGPLIWLLNRFDRRNTSQHNANMEVLRDIQADVHEIQSDVKVVDQRLSKHIDWHIHKD